MLWDNETVLKFLELYQMHPCIWDPGNESHKIRQRVNDAWNEIRKLMEVPCSIQELKKKKESLMSAYRSYRIKIMKSERSGSSADFYQPSWFAYTLMDSFLGSVYSCPSQHYELQDEETTPEKSNEDSNTSKGTSNTNATIGFHESRPEQEFSPQHESQFHSGAREGSPTPTPPKKRQHNPSKLLQTTQHMDQTYNYMQHVSQQHDGDDECSVFGILVAKKLRKLPEERRDIMMIKISQLFIDERRNFSMHNASFNRPNSSSTIVSYASSPPQMFQDNHHTVSFPAERSSPALFSYVHTDPISLYNRTAALLDDNKPIIVNESSLPMSSNKTSISQSKKPSR